jgi:NitT/TauT family transport system ATP-binding protein
MTGKPVLEPAVVVRAARSGGAGPFSLEVGPREFFALIGRREWGLGALVRMIAGLERPEAGAVTIGGEPVAGPRRDAGYVASAPSLLAHTTALGNVLLAASLRGLRPADFEPRARELLALAGAADHASDPAPSLSVPMALRVAVCRALLPEPSILLLDDPFSQADPLDREQVCRDLQRLHLDRPVTTLLAGSCIHEAVLLADRVAVASPSGALARVFDVELPRPRRLDKLTSPKVADYCALVRMTLEGLGALA